MPKTKLPTNKYFRTERVNVKFKGVPIQAQSLPLPMMRSMPVAPGGFQPFRIVINLKLVDAKKPATVVLKFDPHIEVHVDYTAADLASAKKAGQPLSLGYWDGTHWIRFTPKDHRFHLKPRTLKGAVGRGEVRLSQWTDPPVAWGT